MTMLRKIVVPAFGLLAVWTIQSFSAGPGNAVRAAAPGGAAGGAARGGGGSGAAAPVDTGPRSIAPYFTPATAAPKAPDAEGFLQRWMLLEPISNNLNTNTGFNESFVHNAIKTQNFPDQFTKIPKDGDKVTIAGKELAWHALDSAHYNVKLFRFAYGLNKTIYGVLFFAVTVVDSPRDMDNVRLAVGSNSASVWWLNGKEVAGLFGDRRMVADDVVSKRLTLKKGPNVIHGAVINGPGMSDFCVRFLDDKGEPVKDLTQSFENAGK